MPPAVSEWTGLFLRWIHILAGIFWIGQTYYFTKLEGRMALDEEAARAAGRLPQVWMVHSGSFSLVEKHTTLKTVPPKFYWFRWEALVTWISGFLLLGLLYYSGGLLLDESVPLRRLSARFGRLPPRRTAGSAEGRTPCSPWPGG